MMSQAATFIPELTQAPTPLTVQLQMQHPELRLDQNAGALTPHSFSAVEAELAAALSGSACFDLGYRTRIRVTGEDRLRWLNGMVSNAIQALPEGQGNYNFILNAQGRIQGDAYIYRRANDLLLDTDRSQAEKLFAHLDHFIIMDDVELQSLDEATTGIGLIGPQSGSILDAIGLTGYPRHPLQLVESTLKGIPITLVHAYGPLRPRFELWFAPEHALTLWQTLLAAGAAPAGNQAIEALRILGGTPLYGIDIHEKHLAQETNQARALNFTKGCYLGQEIVERIRSRATVHRNLRQFQLFGRAPALPAELRSEEDPATAIGQLTSVAEIENPEFRGSVAIGSIRVEALERKSKIIYDGGTVSALDLPPISAKP